MMPTTAKACGQYLNSILALREAIGEGYDEALLLDQAGRICEGSGENIFLVKDKKLLTNDERHSILLGVTRDAVITIAGDLGIKGRNPRADAQGPALCRRSFLYRNSRRGDSNSCN